MKGFLVLFAIAAVAAANQCPAEQVNDPTIEKLLPHADCTKFYKCAYGQPAEQLCPTSLYYNIENEQCDYRENVDCGDRTDPNVETLVPEVSAESQEEISNPETNVSQENGNENQETDTASQENNGDQENNSSSKEDSNSNQESDAASDESNANQENNNSASAEEVEGGVLPNGCPIDGESNVLLPHRFKMNWFYQCAWGKRVLFRCPAGLIFNAELQVCDYKSKNKEEKVDSVRFVDQAPSSTN